MFETKKKIIDRLERQLRKTHGLIDKQQAEISTLKIQNAGYERLVERLEKENEAEQVLIDGLERSVKKLRQSLEFLDKHRKKTLRERDEARCECAKWAEVIKTIERDGLCCVCALEASRTECGVTCNFKYQGGKENGEQ